MDSRSNNGVKTHTTAKDTQVTRENAAADLERYLSVVGEIGAIAEALGAAFRVLRDAIRAGDNVDRRDLGNLNDILTRLCVGAVDAGIRGTTLLVMSAHQFGD